MKVAILTSADQWFEPYAHELAREMDQAPLYHDHRDIKEPVDCLFILAYHRLVPASILRRHRFNPVVHESALPKGKGWAPLFWQILEGKSEIVCTLFEAQGSADSGDVYLNMTLYLTGYELNKGLRDKQARMTREMCLAFYRSPEAYLPPRPQTGESSFYPKRTPADSRLDVDRSIREQFNLLRTVDNNAYPAFFDIDGYRYRLKVEAVDNSELES